MKKYVDKDKLQEFAAKLHAKQKSIFATKSQVGSPLVASLVADMTDTDKIYVYVGSETGYTSGNWYYHDGSDWMSGGVYNSAAIQTDTTLSNSGMAADAKTVGDELADIRAEIWDGLTADIKSALLQLASKVAYIDEDGQDYYDDLYNALYPPANLVSISAVYTQSGTVYDTDSLDSLKADLVVTATYDDSTTATVPSTDYVLSGTLAEGTSTITVSYGGKTATFTVTVTSYWTWKYVPSTDGKLTDQSYVYQGTTGTYTEEVTNGLLHIVVPQTSTKNDGLQMRFSDGNGTYNVSTGEIQAKIKFSSVSTSADNAQGNGLRLQMSQGGTQGCKLAFRKISGNYLLQYYNGGSTDRAKLADIELDKWYVVGITINASNYVVTLDGETIHSGTDWNTATITYNGLYIISEAQATVSQQESTEAFIEYIGFKSGGEN